MESQLRKLGYGFTTDLPPRLRQKTLNDKVVLNIRYVDAENPDTTAAGYHRIEIC